MAFLMGKNQEKNQQEYAHSFDGIYGVLKRVLPNTENEKKKDEGSNCNLS